MAKHHIYIREDVESQLAELAKRSGISARDFIRARIETLSAEINISSVKEEIRRCQIALSGVLQILEILVPEIAVAASLLRSQSMADRDAQLAAQDDVLRLEDATQAVIKSLMEAMGKDRSKGDPS
jgi:hypothetical protein